MTITLDPLPLAVDEALRKKAQAEGRSLQEVAAERLARGLGVNGQTGATPGSLRELAGTMSEEDARAIEETVKWMDEGDISQRS